MSKEGESEDDIYYCDEKRVLSLSKGSFYAINSRLLDLFVSLKVKKPDVKKKKEKQMTPDIVYMKKRT